MSQYSDNKRQASESMRKNVRQTNHDGCVIPPEVILWAEQPLYLLIARWCLLQKAWTGRKQIAQAFHISERRASYQLTCITRKPELIRCELRRVSNGRALNSSYEVWVHELFNQSVLPAPQKHNSRRRSRVGGSSEEMRAMLHQLWPRRG
ncbi:CaiF/GrlA family transcriptional regulator [Citrobacter braakii]|uniref:CaiF/GrlA family transcriptional regulator n=1 Tax=Citrobacter braakii TaxID=57706 RepID=UPI00351D04AA